MKDLTKLSMEDFQLTVKASCILTRVYALTAEYCGRKVNYYIEWVKYFHITRLMLP